MNRQDAKDAKGPNQEHIGHEEDAEIAEEKDKMVTSAISVLSVSLRFNWFLLGGLAVEYSKR
jgi:hypothetical protein